MTSSTEETKTAADSPAAESPAPAAAQAAASAVAPAGDKEPVKYDFSQPVGLGTKFSQNLTTIGESFAKQLGFNLSSLIRTNVEVEFTSVTQVLFRDYLGEFANPSCMGIFSAAPLKGQSVVSADIKLMLVLLEKLLGGEGKPVEQERDFTEIETRVFSSVLERFLGDFREAAKRTVDLTPSFSRIESNPSFINIMTGGEKAIVVTLQVTIGELAGPITFCFPMSGFEPVMDRFDPKEDGIVRTPREIQEDHGKIVSTLHTTPIQVVAELGQTSISLDDLIELKLGDTLVMDHSTRNPIPLKVGRKILFVGQPGKVYNRKAIKILGRYSTEA